MGKAFPIVDGELSARELNKYISKDVPAVVCKSNTGDYHIVTQYDLIQVL
jgi:cystathionine beta-synthase